MSSFRRTSERVIWHGWGEENVYTLLVGKPKDKDHLEDSRHRWEDDIKMDLTEIRCGVQWIHPVQYMN
jgi:hypothetical protein